jgi:hypothetical protein
MKIIEERPSFKRRINCMCCGSLLEITEEDVRYFKPGFDPKEEFYLTPIGQIRLGDEHFGYSCWVCNRGCLFGEFDLPLETKVNIRNRIR